MVEPRRSVDSLVHVAAAARLDVASIPQPPAWTEHAVCSSVDMEIFFPEKGGSTAAARAVCAKCPVKRQCLQFALDNNEPNGVWGGVGPRERRRLQRGAA